MKNLMLFVGLVGMLMIPAPAHAVGLFAGEEVTITEPMAADVYAAGGMVKATKTINGDIVVAGGSVTIDEDVTGDVVVFGGQVMINGDVSDDVLVFGGTVTVHGDIGDDLSGAAGQVTIGKESLIGGDIVFAGGLIDSSATVNGSAHIAAGEVIWGGNVQGDLKVQYSEKMTLVPGSVVMGNLYYVAKQEMTLPTDIVKGKVQYTPLSSSMAFAHQNAQKAAHTAAIIAAVSWIVLVLIIAALYTWLIRPAVLRIGMPKFADVGWKRLGFGLAALIGGPIVAVLLMITGVGLPIGIIVLLLWIILVFLGMVFASLIVGSILMPIDELSTFGQIIGSFLVGALILAVIGVIPLIGGLVKFIAILVAMGAVLLYHGDMVKFLRKNNMA